MNILLINPPNCGKSIPEERYGITSIKQIFRGEPLSLEVLAGNLPDHEITILDLKPEPDSLPQTLEELKPDLVGITGVTCEANTILKIASFVKKETKAIVVVGGIHASSDPEFFNREEVDYVVVGLGKASFRELVTALEKGRKGEGIPGVAKTSSRSFLSWVPRRYSREDLVDDSPPAYELVARYRNTYKLKSLDIEMGFVCSAMGCPFSCAFCCISSLTGGRYLTHKIDSVVRDVGLLGDIPVIRLVDANTFGNPQHAAELCKAIRDAGVKKNFLADVRSDTVVRHPDLMEDWKKAGLRSVIIGFEEVTDEGLERMNKANRVTINTEAINILHDLGITIVGDFIVSPDYAEKQFDELGEYITGNNIDLPMLTILTPLPGTRLYESMKDKIIIHDLDYYTLTNAVVPTRLKEEEFYSRFSDLLRMCHEHARL